MMHEEALLTTIFKIINVGVLIAGIVYVFRTRVMGQLRLMISAQQRIYALAFHEHLQAQVRQKKLQQELEEQRRECERIKKNLVLWLEREQHKQRLLTQEREYKRSQLEHRAATQSQYLTLTMAQDAIMTRALAQAHHLLQQKFNTQQAGQQYVHTVVQQLGKGMA